MRVLLDLIEGILNSLVRELLSEVNGYDLCITGFLRVVDQRLLVKSFYLLFSGLQHASAARRQVRVHLLGQYPQWLDKVYER
ncbi:tRNA dihydrouridine(16) synthase DusC [Pectobacterium brasiliense]|nr:tRNA dihydrouridine(16) synthase DusC [Pectobacterium brasiliense]